MAELIFLGVDSGRPIVYNGWRFRFSMRSCMDSMHSLLDMMDAARSSRPNRRLGGGDWGGISCYHYWATTRSGWLSKKVYPRRDAPPQRGLTPAIQLVDASRNAFPNSIKIARVELIEVRVRVMQVRSIHGPT